MRNASKYLALALLALTGLSGGLPAAGVAAQLEDGLPGAGGSVTVGAPAVMTLRLTYYVDHGVTYSGTQARAGVAACSWSLALGTRLRLPDGRVVVCEDRGQLGHTGWLDVWVGSPAEGRALAAAFGSSVTVEILR